MWTSFTCLSRHAVTYACAFHCPPRTSFPTARPTSHPTSPPTKPPPPASRPTLQPTSQPIAPTAAPTALPALQPTSPPIKPSQASVALPLQLHLQRYRLRLFQPCRHTLTGQLTVSTVCVHGFGVNHHCKRNFAPFSDEVVRKVARIVMGIFVCNIFRE